VSIEHGLRFFEAAEHHPQQPALIAQGTPYTFGELVPSVRRTVAWLLRRGISPGDPACRVAFVARAELDTAVLLYALLELGVPAVPIHPTLTPREREVWTDTVQPALVIDGLPGRLEDSGLPPVQRAAVDEDSPLAIVQSSGTTGRPKGVVLSRGAVCAAARASAANLGWQPEDRWLMCMPPAHIGGLSIPVRTLIARRCAVLEPFEPEQVIATLERHHVTLASLVPTMLERLLDAEPRWVPPPQLRAVLLGGAAAPPELVRRARRRGVPVLTTYGLTEACAQVATQPYGALPDPGPGGKPLAGVQVRIAGGEIQVAGPTCMSGWFPPDAHPSPFTEDGWLRTGDLGRFDEHGRLHVIGRLDDRIVTGGENVDPGEVERVLRELPSVKDACVVGVPDPEWGQRVAAAVVCPPDTPPDAHALEQALRERLASHKRPRQWAFVETLPRTASGKVDRRAARAVLSERT
jgi:O-succinylbenzoic acid--CoA ligase